MYKVFINRNWLILTDLETAKGKAATRKIRYQNPEQLAKWVQRLEGSKRRNRIVIYHYDPNEMWMHFTRMYTYVQAAGGLVRKPKKQFLMIFRNGRWDIPKGHMKKGERPEYAAIREVEEECGISGLWIKKPLDQTYHLYKRNGVTYIKKTFWFIMKTRHSGELIPQIEEGIEEVRWCDLKDLPMLLDNTFPLVEGLLKKALKIKGSLEV